MLLELGYTLLIRSCIIAYDLKGVNLEQRKGCPGNYKRAYSPEHVQLRPRAYSFAHSSLHILL